MPVTYAPMDFWHVVFARTGSAVPKIFPRAFGVAMIGALRCHTRTAPATHFVPNSCRCLTGRAASPMREAHPTSGARGGIVAGMRANAGGLPIYVSCRGLGGAAGSLRQYMAREPVSTCGTATA